MIGVVLATVVCGILVALLHAIGEIRPRSMLTRIIIGGYFLRIIVQFFIRDVRLFSHVIGGDALAYEEYGRVIANIWRVTGIHFVTSAELTDLGPTSLPENLFAVVMWLNGGMTSRLACTSLVALAAALAALNIYSLAVQFGAQKRNALLVASIIYLQPAVLFYTSDTYKDGLVLCFTVGALGSALRLGFRLSALHAIIGVICLWALWYVRFYLVFVTVAPLIVGAAGIGSKSFARPLFAALALAIAAMILAGLTDFLQLASERAAQTFALGTSAQVLEYNSRGGSGVTFDDGGTPYGALPAKLAYTLFAPFPWASGSLGFQFGKIDAFLWYFIMYRAGRAALRCDRRLLIMLLAFIFPCTVMYAMSVSNIGLIMRQRLVIVAATAILAALYAPQRKRRASGLSRDMRVLERVKRQRLAA